MTYIIIKKTRGEREAALAESRSRSSHRDIEGVARTTEEAHDLQRQRQREGVERTGLYAVSNDSPEAKQAKADELARVGLDPDMHLLHSESTKHDVDHRSDVIGHRDGKPVRAGDIGS